MIYRAKEKREPHEALKLPTERIGLAASQFIHARRFGRDCRNLKAMESHPGSPSSGLQFI